MSISRTLSDALADLPDLSDKIVKSDDPYCGTGAFSDVYKRQYNSGAGPMDVAVKSFRFLFTLGENEGDSCDSRGTAIRKMIRRELGIWRRLDHPNIVPFLGIAYGFGRPGHASLVAMWMANGTLQTFLGQHDDRLTVAHKLQLLLDIANGLSYLHSFPIIHGDLSPNNVLIDHNYSARLTDFGYASMVGDIPEVSLYLQMSTMRPGTIRWAAPEHFAVETDSEETKETSQTMTKSDIYSFGNIGLLVLSGRHPWSEIRRDEAVIVQLSRGNRPKRPPSCPIDDQHWELIERCWSSVDDRPCAPIVVFSLQQLLCSHPHSVPLSDFFRAPPHPSNAPSSPNLVVLTSGHLAEQNEPDAQTSGLSEATPEAVSRDGAAKSVTVHDSYPGANVEQWLSHQKQEVIACVEQDTHAAPGGVRTVDASIARQPRKRFHNPIRTDEDNSVYDQRKAKNIESAIAKQTRTRKEISDILRGLDKPDEMAPVNVMPIPQSNRRNVIFIGEIGSGKSSLINMISGSDVGPAAVSPDMRACTNDVAHYDITIGDRAYRLWDTPGFEKAPKFCASGQTVQSLRRFIQERDRLGELDLLVLCVQGSRAIGVMTSVYNLFCSPSRRVSPVVIAITHLEKQAPVMDRWWKNNERELGRLGFVFDGHACVSCLYPHHRRWASQWDIRDLISAEYRSGTSSPMPSREET